MYYINTKHPTMCFFISENTYFFKTPKNSKKIQVNEGERTGNEIAPGRSVNGYFSISTNPSISPRDVRELIQTANLQNRIVKIHIVTKFNHVWGASAGIILNLKHLIESCDVF